MSNKMRGFTSWFAGGKSNEDEKNIGLVLDSTKGVRKRFSALQSLLKSYGDRVPDLLKVIPPSQLVDPLVSILRTDTTRTKGKTAWEEISMILKFLTEITRFKPLQSIDTIQEIATACLNEANRWELREYGFNLILNLLNNDVSQEIPGILLLSAIDFTQLRSEESKGPLYFIGRTSIANLSNTADFTWVNLVRTPEKLTENSQGKYLADVERVNGSGFSKGAKDCIVFLSKTLEYALSEEINRVEHFQRWFGMLKHTILYLLYPTICSPGPTMGHDWGFREGVPPILHYVIVRWVISIIKIPEFAAVVMDDPEEFGLVKELIGKSFHLTEVYSSFCVESAKITINLYEEWMFMQSLSDSLKNNWRHVMGDLLIYPISLFDFSQDTSPRRIGLCKDFLKMLNTSKDNNLEREVILACALKLSLKTLETFDLQTSIQEIVAEFLINMLADSIELLQIPWEDYIDILKMWAAKSEFITQTWLEKMKLLTGVVKEKNFQPGVTLDGWLWMLKILGDPLKFAEKVQVKWVNALQELIQLILTPAHLSPRPNLMLEIFFLTLSKLIRQGYKESQRISMVTLVSIFASTKCEEMPMQCYLQHLSLLIFLSSEKDYLNVTVLESASKVLDYPGMHFLINTFLKIAQISRKSSLKFLFYIMCLPNYYGHTKLENTDEVPLTYAELKDSIQDILVKCIDESEIGVSAMYGLTVFILEELQAGNENISELVTKVIQAKCLSDNEDIAICALNCLQTLSSSFPNLSKNILNFLISRCLSEIPNSKEKVIKAVLNTIQNWLLVNNSTPCESSLLSNLFSNLSLKLSTVDSSNPLEAEISTMVSFISIYYLNYPFKGQNSTVFHSIIPDEVFAENPNVKPIHYALGASVIFTMIPHPEKAKFVLRNQFGRFCWEAYDYMVFDPANNSEAISKALDLMQEAKIELNIKEPPPPLHDEPLLPKLMNFIKESYPECYIPEKNIEAGSEILKMIESVEKMEAECKFEEKRPEKEKSSFNMGRFFIANFGLIDKLVQLQADERFDRGMGILDGLKPRESVKIGVIYVAPGQQDEREILANTGGSLEFQDFLQNLGEVVDIRDHQGNLGGLDPGGSAGFISISYADWQFDVIFHVVPLMPTDPTDGQQVLKKRHVGNDIVHIVWSDHYRDYRHDTMLTHFNFIIIVIYPLMKGMFKIQIMKKINVDCGPLQDGMVIPAHLLPNLVRQTAIHANQQVRLIKHPNYEKQTQIRKKQIQELIQRYPAQQMQKHLVYASMF